MSSAVTLKLLASCGRRSHQRGHNCCTPRRPPATRGWPSCARAGSACLCSSRWRNCGSARNDITSSSRRAPRTASHEPIRFKRLWLARILRSHLIHVSKFSTLPVKNMPILLQSSVMSWVPVWCTQCTQVIKLRHALLATSVPQTPCLSECSCVLALVCAKFLDRARFTTHVDVNAVKDGIMPQVFLWCTCVRRPAHVLTSARADCLSRDTNLMWMAMMHP